MINHKLLTLFWGKCWHEWAWETPTVCHCIHCGFRPTHEDGIPMNPDFSDDRTMLDFLRWFWEEKYSMWHAFDLWTYDKWSHLDIDWTPWLFSLSDNEPRIMQLLGEWLALPEAREKFGVVECTAWMDGSCREADCNYHKQGLTVHPDGYGCYIIAEWAKGE